MLPCGKQQELTFRITDFANLIVDLVLGCKKKNDRCSKHRKKRHSMENHNVLWEITIFYGKKHGKSQCFMEKLCFAQVRILAEKMEADVVVLHNVPEGSNLKHFDPRFCVGIKIHFRHSNTSIPLNAQPLLRQVLICCKTGESRKLNKSVQTSREQRCAAPCS